MNIVIVTTGHPPLDERIFYKFGISLTKHKHNVSIVCSTEIIDTTVDGIRIRGFRDDSLPKKEKIERLFAEITPFDPSLIICCEPLPILSARKFKKKSSKKVKIIYDITEYYPLPNMLINYSGFLRIIQYLRFASFNAYVSNLVDFLFIGEEGKANFYKIIAPGIPKTIIGYYPPQKYFHYSPPVYDGKNFTLCYVGNISSKRGFIRFADLVKKVAERFEDKVIAAKFLGLKSDDLSGIINEFSDFQNIKVLKTKRVDYKNYSSEFEGVDLCIDLRDKNIVFNRSLPIKVFDYIASGKPFIISNLDSLNGFEDLKDAGIMIDPDDLGSALQRIADYLNNSDKLINDSLAAYRLFKHKYNWEITESRMIDVINSMFKKP